MADAAKAAEAKKVEEAKKAEVKPTTDLDLLEEARVRRIMRAHSGRLKNLNSSILNVDAAPLRMTHSRSLRPRVRVMLFLRIFYFVFLLMLASFSFYAPPLCRVGGGGPGEGGRNTVGGTRSFLQDAPSVCYEPTPDSQRCTLRRTTGMTTTSQTCSRSSSVRSLTSTRAPLLSSRLDVHAATSSRRGSSVVVNVGTDQ